MCNIRVSHQYLGGITINHIRRLANIITEDPDIILEADREETRRFKSLLNNVNYKGPSPIDDLELTFTVKDVSRLKDQDDEEGVITHDWILIDLHDPNMTGDFSVPVTEQIIQKVLQNPNQVGRILAQVVVAWGAKNTYDRWVHRFERKTPRPREILDKSTNKYIGISKASPEQLAELDEWCRQQDDKLTLIGNIMARYGLDFDDED